MYMGTVLAGVGRGEGCATEIDDDYAMVPRNQLPKSGNIRCRYRYRNFPILYLDQETIRADERADNGNVFTFVVIVIT